MTTSIRIARVHISLALVYLIVALLSLVDFILAQLGLAPALGNLYWFRLHMITIGVLAQAVLGVLPLLLVRQLHTTPPRAAAQWALLALFNLGLLLLSVGQVLWSQPLRSSGGWVLLLAVALWLALLAQMWRRAPRPRPLEAAFFLAGPSYLLLGVSMALSMLESWPAPVSYQGIKEAHVHNNIFGFTGIVLAGVALNVLPALFGRSLARPAWVRPTFWLMTVGAFLLWLGPYSGVTPATGGGLLVYVGGVGLMLANVWQTMRRPVPMRSVHGAHWLISYAWIAAPALAAVVYALLGPERLTPAEFELTVMQGLIYGWILQIVLAFLPAVGGRVLTGAEGWSPPISPAEGSRGSLILLNLSVAAIWLASIALPWVQARPMVAMAYGLLIVAALPYVWRLGRVLHSARARMARATHQP